MQGQYSFLQQDPRFLQQQQQQAAGQRQSGGQLQLQQTGYVQPQSTGFVQQNQNPGYLQSQQTGYVQPQQTGFLQSQQTGYAQPQQAGYVQSQQTGYLQQQQPQRTGYVQPQMTGFASGGMMRPQQTGFGFNGGAGMANIPSVPSLPSQFQGQQQQIMRPAGPSPAPSNFMSSSTSLAPMSAQPTGYGIGFRGQMPALGASSQPFLNTFMPAPGIQQAMGFAGANLQSSQMQFAQQPTQFNGMNLQQAFQQQNQQQIGQTAVKVPWKLSTEEKKSYDQIFRAWDQAGTGFLEGKMSTEVFAQSALPREDLMQIWALADVENRGKLNLAEFHVAMGLIYRRLNGNPIPSTLPPEMVPPSARDLDNSVDFLKDLLKKDNARSTGESYAQHTLGPIRSLHGARSSPHLRKDATMYKHDEIDSHAAYKSRSRHIDRSSVRHAGEDRSTSGVEDMKRELDRTESMLESSRHRDDEDDSLDQELEDLNYRIRRIQDDIEHISRSGRRSEAKDNERRKLQRDLLHLRHEELPRLELRIENRDKERRRETMRHSRDRDARNNRGRFDSDALSDSDDRRRGDSYSDRGSLKSTYDREVPSRGSNGGRRDVSISSHPDMPSREQDSDDRRRESQNARLSSPASVIKSSPPSPPPPPPPPASVTQTMTAEEKKAFIQAEAQRRIQDRLRSLGIGGTSSTQTVDSDVSSRLEQQKREAEMQALKADKENEEREKQRQIRLEEERLSRLRVEEEINAKASTAMQQVKEEVIASPAANKPDQNELLAEEEELLRQREQALAKEKAARLARIKQLEEEEEESRRLEEEFKKKKAMFSGRPATSPPVAKKAPPPPPAARMKAPAATVSRSSPQVPQLPPSFSDPGGRPGSTPAVTVDSKPVIDAVPLNTKPENADQSNSLLRQSTPNPPTSSTNPFHRMNASTTDVMTPTNSASFGTKLSPNNPFFHSTSNPPAVAAPAQPAYRPPPRPQDSDDEWDAAKDYDDDSDEEGATTARQARQGLAEALFGGIMPSRPQSAAANPVNSTPGAPTPPAPPPPAAPAPPTLKVPTITTSDTPPNRGMLLGEIQGGARLRKTQTHDRSASALAGRVLDSATSPAHATALPVEDNAAIDRRRSVDWIGGMAADGMRPPPAHQPSLHSHEEESAGTHQDNGTGVDEIASSFDLTQTIRVRTLYSYDAQRPEDLPLVENIVISAHPSKSDGEWLYGAVESTGKSGTFPKSYVEELKVIWGTALYDYTASGPDEISLGEQAKVAVVDASDPDWFKVESGGRIGLAPGAYIELGG